MNFLTSYIEYAAEITDAPLDFHQFISIVTAGAIIGKSRHIQIGAQKVFPNFYMLIIAPSSLYHKSTALSISREAILTIDSTKVFPSDFSQEKMSENLSLNSQGIFYWFEWKTLMGMLEKNYMAGAKAWLTELFDSYTFQVVRKKITFLIENPCVSILSATTTDWFLDNLKSGDIAGGFLGRFLFVNSQKKIRNDALPPEPNIGKKAFMENDLQNLLDLEIIKMTLSLEASKEYNSWYQKFCVNFEALPSAFKTLFARLNIYLLKIAIVIETCKTQSNEISLETIRNSIQYVSWLQNSTLELCNKEFSFNRHEALEKKVLKLLIEKGGKFDRTGILRYANISAKEFQSVIETLEQKERIFQDYEKKDGSQRKTQMVFLLKEK